MGSAAVDDEDGIADGEKSDTDREEAYTAVRRLYRYRSKRLKTPRRTPRAPS